MGTRPTPVSEELPEHDQPLTTVVVAEGRTNGGIARRLWLTERTVETHIGSILTKLGPPASADDHRRVLAVLMFLRAGVPGRP